MTTITVQELCDMAGGTGELAKIAGVRSQAVSIWKRTNKIPVERVLQIEKGLRYKVTRYEMRPDIYGE